MAFTPASLQLRIQGAPNSTAFTEGRFNSQGQKDLAAANHRLAEVGQSYVVRYMAGAFVRPNVSTGRLLKVTADPKNVFASAFIVGIGRPDFLDRSRAKYWRTIEEGSAAAWTKRSFLSLQLLGVFGATINGRYAGPRFTLPGAATGGKFRPITPNKKGKARFGKVKLRPFSPTHEIAPMHAYANLWQRNLVQESAIFSARKYLNTVLGGGNQIAGKDFAPPGVDY